MTTEDRDRPLWTDKREGSGRAGTHRILVAADDPSLLRFLAAILADRGHEVRASTDAEDAKRVLEGDQCSLAILDLRISGGTGLGMVRQVRGRGSDVPIIVMSGAFPPAIFDAAGEIPRLALLEKPFSCGGLEEAIRKASGNDGGI